VALAVVCVGLVVRVQRLNQALTDEKKKSAHAMELLEIMNDPNAQKMTLVAESRRPPRVKTIYQPKKGHILLLADSLDPIPEDKVYELWLLPANGGSPMPCATFQIDSEGNSMKMIKMEHGVDAKAFAVTVEPEGGSKTPTMPIVYGPEG
jgi:hypothetical protein